MMILDFSWNFKPERIIDGFEVHPCKESDGVVEQCEPDEAHFWSIYVRYNPYNPGDKEHSPQGFGGLDCICDCDTEEQANEVLNFLTNLCTNYKPHRT